MIKYHEKSKTKNLVEIESTSSSTGATDFLLGKRSREVLMVEDKRNDSDWDFDIAHSAKLKQLKRKRHK